MENKKGIIKRQGAKKNKVLERLKEMPIIQIACNKAGVSRATYYRWRGEDKTFKDMADSAITEGELLINDMSESQIIKLIKETNLPAIKLWLRHHHPKYTLKTDLVIRTESQDKLTEEQEALIKNALDLASFDKVTINNKANGKRKDN